MKLLTIDHTTVYRYRNPIRFGEHRLMFRPRDSHDMRLVASRLDIEPLPKVHWMHDVFGNSIAVAAFEDEARELRLRSMIAVEHYAMKEIDFPLEAFARTLPFSYAPDDIPDLGRTIERHYADPEHKVDHWVRRFLGDNGSTQTLPTLLAMTQAIKTDFSYAWRTEPGVQTPAETLAYGSGSCRDFALLMMEALRSLGLASRFVSGYLFDESVEGGETGQRGAGATHAWVDVFLPGAGWVEFDPTNGSAGGKNLIRVGVARDPSQATPIRGAFIGGPNDFIDMTVEVSVLSGNLVSD
jgi:transglutaminase-like putative cysteine protease